jgi:hypothetical protein
MSIYFSALDISNCTCPGRKSVDCTGTYELIGVKGGLRKKSSLHFCISVPSLPTSKAQNPQQTAGQRASDTHVSAWSTCVYLALQEQTSKNHRPKSNPPFREMISLVLWLDESPECECATDRTPSSAMVQTLMALCREHLETLRPIQRTAGVALWGTPAGPLAVMNNSAPWTKPAFYYDALWIPNWYKTTFPIKIHTTTVDSQRYQLEHLHSDHCTKN